jgi:hypothetical protein
MKVTWENRSTRGKTCPSATLSITNPTWTDPGSNPGLCGGRPAADRLNHGTATSDGHWFMTCVFRGSTQIQAGPPLVTTALPGCTGTYTERSPLNFSFRGRRSRKDVQ